MEEFLTVGQIINIHGIRGEVKVYPLTDDMERFKNLKSGYINGIERKIESCKLLAKVAVLKIEGIDSPEEAYKYRDTYIKVKRENAVKLEKGQFYVADIIGCKVVDENSLEVGEVKDVIFTGSNDVYLVKGETEVLVPVIKSVIVKIDAENKLIVIKPVQEWS